MPVRNKLCFDPADLASLIEFCVPGGGEGERENQTTVLVQRGFIGERGTHATFSPGSYQWWVWRLVAKQ